MASGWYVSSEGAGRLAAGWGVRGTVVLQNEPKRLTEGPVYVCGTGYGRGVWLLQVVWDVSGVEKKLQGSASTAADQRREEGED